MKKVYFDHAATSFIDKQVLEAMLSYFKDFFGNPSELHFLGQESKKAVEESRKTIANFFNCKKEEIIFTSGATESINLAHKGLTEALKNEEKPHIITSSIEHKAVLDSCKHLEKLDLAKVTYLPVNEFGLVSLESLKKAVLPETRLVSIMYVNNEVGTVEPIKEIGDFLKKLNKKREKKIFFHTDATQAIAYLDVNVDHLNVDLLSLTGHKINAPKGVGVLYVRKGTKLIKQQDGGGQEFNLRAGTENVPYIAGLGKAISLINNKDIQKIKDLSKKLTVKILKIKEVFLTGHPTLRSPHINSFVVKNAESESMLLLLSDRGVAVSAMSACNSDLLQPSHVLKAMKVPENLLNNSIRFSLGKNNTLEEVNYVVKNFKEVVNYLRKLAPKL